MFWEYEPAYRIGNEAIAHQFNSKLKAKMIEAVHKLRALGSYTPEIVNQSGLMQAIRAETGLDIRIKVDKSSLANAYVYVPQLDRNNPLLPNFMRGWQANSDLETVLNFTNGKFDGIVDRKAAKVHGTFTKMSVPIYVTTGLLDSKDRFTDAEVAAIIAHELGHVFGYFEYLIELVSTNYAATYTAQRMMKTARDVDRVKLLSEYEAATNSTLSDKETIFDSTSGESVFVHLVSDTIRNRRNAEGDSMYSLRGFEYISDQFATRHGFGVELATGLAKIYQMYGHRSTYSMFTHIMVNVIGTCLILATLTWLAVAVSPIVTVLTAILLIGQDPDFKIYDEPAERLNRIRNEMVDSLKTADQEARASIVYNISVVDETLKCLSDKTNVYELIWAYMIPAGRKAKKSREFQQDLEKLIHNDLFVSAGQLQTL